MVNVGTSIWLSMIKLKGHICYRTFWLHQKYTDDNIIDILNFLTHNTFDMFGRQLFQQTVFILIGTNCAPLLADLFLYWYEAKFWQILLKQKKTREIGSIPYVFTIRYIDDVLSLSNSHIYLSWKQRIPQSLLIVPDIWTYSLKMTKWKLIYKDMW